MPDCGRCRLQELRCWINRRGFAADPRSIPTAEAEVLFVPAEVGIIAIIGSAKTVVMGSHMVNGGAGLRSQTIPISWTHRAAAFITGCEGRAGNSSGQDSNGGKYF
jgi:hypothetical protein